MLILQAWGRLEEVCELLNQRESLLVLSGPSFSINVVPKSRMLSDDFDPVSDSRSEGFCSSWIVRLNATEPLI